MVFIYSVVRFRYNVPVSRERGSRSVTPVHKGLVVKEQCNMKCCNLPAAKGIWLRIVQRLRRGWERSVSERWLQQIREDKTEQTELEKNKNEVHFYLKVLIVKTWIWTKPINYVGGLNWIGNIFLRVINFTWSKYKVNTVYIDRVPYFHQ